MLLLDVNVLVYAHREAAPRHAEYRAWLEDVTNGDAAFSVADLVFSGFLRIVTHPGIFDPPSPLDKALSFVEDIRKSASFVSIAPGERHWQIFTKLCREAEVKGNLTPDAYLAAMAVESGSEWITTDGDYARFPGLRWRRPF